MKRVITEDQRQRNLEAQRRRRAKNPERVREVGRASEFRRRLKRYGISEEHFLFLQKEQDNKCKICSIDLTGIRAAVDHCHSTGKVRGLLCMNCNTGLGQFKDSTNLLQKAMDYLKND